MTTSETGTRNLDIDRDDEVTEGDRAGLNKEVKERKERVRQRELAAHHKRTGRFLELDLPVQTWATLKASAPTPGWASTHPGGPSPRRGRPSKNEWWDDAIRRLIDEVQRVLRFTVGYIRADETQPYRHVHIAIVAHQPVPLRVVEEAWLTVIGANRGDRVWVEPYSPPGGGIGYQMKADGEYGCDWQVSLNIDLFRRSWDGRLRRPSTSRERRNGRRIQKQRFATVKPSRIVPPLERNLDPDASLPVGVGCLQEHREAVDAAAAAVHTCTAC